MTTIHIRHGYTMGDLQRIAAQATRHDRSLSTDAVTRFDVALSAIAEYLCAAEHPPEWPELVRVGWQGIYAELAAMRHTFNQDPRQRGFMPNAMKFWIVRHPNAEDERVEQIAVQQIWAALHEKDQEPIAALALHQDYRRAAESMGIQYDGFQKRLASARIRFRRHWFAPDPSPPIRGRDRRVGVYGKALETHCVRGHERTPDNLRRTTGACITCEKLRRIARTARLREEAAS